MRFAVWLAALAVALVQPAQAATVVITKNFDLTDGLIIGFNGPRYRAQFELGLDTPFQLAVGDTLDITLQLNSGAFELTDPLNMYFMALMSDAGNPQTTAISVLDFIGGTGPLLSTSLNASACCGVLGPNFFGPFQSAPGAVSFTGLRLQSTVTGYSPGGGSHSYHPLFVFGLDGIAVDDVHSGIPLQTSWPGTVPEPSTWALMILGIGLVGLALRHRGQAATGHSP